MSRKPIFKDGSPSVAVESTKADDDGAWLTSGTVTFALESGETVTMEFKGAKTREAALRQGLEGLEWYVARLDRAAKKLREGLS